jgi:hypothetical protein
MKEYGCCPKFRRGDNSTYTFTKRRGHVLYLVSATFMRELTRSEKCKHFHYKFNQTIQVLINTPFNGSLV